MGGFRGRVFHDEAVLLDQLQEIKRAQHPNDFLLVRDDHVMDAVVAHEASGDVHIVVLGNRIDFLGHDLTDPCVTLQRRHQIGGRDDPDEGAC